MRDFKHSADEYEHGAFSQQSDICCEMEEVSEPVIDSIPNIPFWLYLIDDSAIYQKCHIEQKENKHGLEDLETIEKSTSRFKFVISKQF